MYIFTRVHVYVHMYTCICTYLHVYVHIYMYTHIVFVYIYIFSRWASRADLAFRNSIKDQVQEHYPTIFDEMWTNEITTACVTGDWSGADKKSSGVSRKNVALRLQRYNTFGDISNGIRCSTSTRSQRTSNRTKQIVNDQYGRRDTSNTPEGQMSGVVQTFTCGTTLSEAASMRVFMRIIYDLLGPKILEELLEDNFETTEEEDDEMSPAGVKQKKKKKRDQTLDSEGIIKKRKLSNDKTADIKHPRHYYLVRVEGGARWKTKYPELVLNLVRSLRRRGEIDRFISCELEDHVLSIRVSSGRNVRVLLCLKKCLQLFKLHKHKFSKEYKKRAGERNTKHWHYQDIAQSETLDFMDSLEERALTPSYDPSDFKKRTTKWHERFTHMEVEQAWGVDGIIPLLLPFSDHNQAPRKTLACTFMKQAICDADNLNDIQLQRLTLYNAQKSVCESRGWKDYDLRGVSPRQIIKMAVWAAKGNQEDATTANQTSKESGTYRYRC